MLDLYNLPTSTKADVQIFSPTTPQTSNPIAQTWVKPRGVKMVYMLALGAGGAGGNGAVGALNAAAGGGGGGSGGQGTLLIPAIFLPDVLMVTVASSGNAQTTIYIDTTATTTASLAANSRLLIVNNGGTGANASAGTQGNGGTAATATNAVDQSLSGVGKYQFFSGQGGSSGGGNTTGTFQNQPFSGLMVCGGCGGGGLPATATVGSDGGPYNGGGVFPTVLGGRGGTITTLPGGQGQNGFQPIPKMFFLYGGTGGGSSHGGATGAGLFGGNGGDGAYGCGGGGGGGCLTGGTAGVGGRGGPGLVVIISW